MRIKEKVVSWSKQEDSEFTAASVLMARIMGSTTFLKRKKWKSCYKPLTENHETYDNSFLLDEEDV